MTTQNVLKQMEHAVAEGGDGVIVERDVSAELRAVDGTLVAYGDVETNALATVHAASSTTLGDLIFTVPVDYDESRDELYVDVFAQSEGDTDTPAIDGAIYRKRAATALSADLDPTISAAISDDSTGGGRVTVDASGLGFQPKDVLSIKLTTGAHATDDVHVYGISIRYRSTIVAQNHSDR